MFEAISDNFQAALSKLKGRGLLSDKAIDDALSELKTSLIESDVNIGVVNEFLADVRAKAVDIVRSKSVNPANQILKVVYDQLNEILGKQYDRKLNFAKDGPSVIMLAGLQGSGKTTFAGKFAKMLKAEKGKGNNPLLVAADLQRPNAVTQLKILGEQIGVDVYAPQPGVTGHDDDKSLVGRIFERKGNPVAVAQDSIEFAKAGGYNFVIVDTAGRLGVDAEMMKEAGEIEAAIKPNETFFVIDSMLGQDAVNTANAFNQAVNLTGIVLTKLDSDARGGAALSVAKVTGKPIMFASMGEKLDDIEVFHPDRMASRILELGDMQTFMEKAENSMSEESIEKVSGKLAKGKGLDFNDFLEQLDQLSKMGDLKKMMGMVPGMAKYKKQLEQFNPKDISRSRAIVEAMTPFERSHPESLDGSRKMRIANGAGTTLKFVNLLIENFGKMNSMTKSMVKSNPSALLGADAPKPVIKPKKKKFGNPAKQAAWEAANRSE